MMILETKKRIKQSTMIWPRSQRWAWSQPPPTAALFSGCTTSLPGQTLQTAVPSCSETKRLQVFHSVNSSEVPLYKLTFQPSWTTLELNYSYTAGQLCSPKNPEQKTNEDLKQKIFLFCNVSPQWYLCSCIFQYILQPAKNMYWQ